MEELQLNSSEILEKANTTEIKREISKLQRDTRAKVKELKKLLYSARLREMEKTGLDPLSGKGRQFIIIEAVKKTEA